nr:hypothetical protein [Pseudomonadota bacterium]
RPANFLTPPENQFLRGSGDNVPTTGLFANNDGMDLITPTLLNLSTATYGENPLGGDAKNGVGFFNGVSSTGSNFTREHYSHYYAGIFADTDLGAPLTAETATGEWRGRFGVVGKQRMFNQSNDRQGTVTDIVVNTDFTLEVTFGETTGAAGTVEAFVARDSTNHIYYHLNGTYDSNGVIRGTVNYGGFADGDRNSPTDPVAESLDNIRINGTLQGLIGQAGAVGVFISDTDTEPTTQATGERGFSGGFVACRYDTANNRCKQ